MSRTDDMQPLFGEPIAEWYRYFAWKPVSTLDRGHRWLCLVWKRKCQPHNYLPGPGTPFFQYRVSAPKEQQEEGGDE